MADETMVDKNADGVASENSKPPVAEKKKRSPGRPKAVAETVATAAAVKLAQETPAKAPRTQRGAKAAVTKTEKAADAKKATPKATRASAVKKGVAPKSVPLDDIAELIKLEEENKKLRKQLAEKLRQENADLRKRLG